MKIRIKVNQPACAHRDLTLKGRYLTLKGIDLKRSMERYTCNACGKPIIRNLKTSVPYWLAPDHHAAETSPAVPFDNGN